MAPLLKDGKPFAKVDFFAVALRAFHQYQLRQAMKPGHLNWAHRNGGEPN
jgi:hypothetical protein